METKLTLDSKVSMEFVVQGVRCTAHAMSIEDDVFAAAAGDLRIIINEDVKVMAN